MLSSHSPVGSYRSPNLSSHSRLNTLSRNSFNQNPFKLCRQSRPLHFDHVRFFTHQRLIDGLRSLRLNNRVTVLNNLMPETVHHHTRQFHTGVFSLFDKQKVTVKVQKPIVDERAGADPKCQEGFALHDTLFFCGSVEQKLQAIDVFIKKGGNINLVNASGHTPLYYALRYNSSQVGTHEILTKLFEHGAEINYAEYQEGSPLHDVLFFVGINKPEVVEALLKNGMPVNHKNKQGHTPLYYALYFNSNKLDTYELVTLLLKSGAKMNFDEYQEGSPLHDVLFYEGTRDSKLDAIQALLENGMPVNYKNKQGHTPLYYAYHMNSNSEMRSEIIVLLRKHGARLSKRERFGLVD